MKKLLSGLCVLGLCAAGMVYLNSCAKQAGPLNPSVPLQTASGSPSKNAPMVSAIIAPGTGTGGGGAYAISQSAQVVFTVPMDATSFVKNSTVLLYTANNNNTTDETLYSSYSLSYNAIAKVLTLTPDNNTWGNDQRYHLVITPGVKSLSGVALDGNGNHKAESAEFDSIHYQFTIGAPTAVPYVNISDSTHAPYKHLDCLSTIAQTVAFNGGGGTFNFGDSEGNVQLTYSYITFTVQFNMSLDPSSVTLATASNSSYTVLLTDNNNLVAPATFGVTTTAAAWLIMTPSGSY